MKNVDNTVMKKCDTILEFPLLSLQALWELIIETSRLETLYPAEIENTTKS